VAGVALPLVVGAQGSAPSAQNLADPIAQKCGPRAELSTAADRACAKAELPALVSLLREASINPDPAAKDFDTRFEQFSEGVLRATGPNDDPVALFNDMLGPNATASAVVSSTSHASNALKKPTPRTKKQPKKQKAVVGTCTLASGVTRTSGNKPTAVGASQCTGGGAAGIAATDIYTQLNRNSGGWYVVASNGLVAAGGYAQVLAVDPANTSGKFFSTSNARWIPKPGWTVSPPFVARSSGIAVYP
jgi:hypothetical protein